MRLVSLLISIGLLFLAAPSYAKTLDELLAKEQLVVSMKLTNEAEIIPNEPTVYKVEVLSAYPFFENMVLDYIDVTNTVVVPPSANTKLDVRTIDGQDWFVQSKKVIIYPLQSGEFVVPEMAINVSINLDNQEKVVGQVSTKSQTFKVIEAPREFSGKNYLVSSDLELNLRKAPRKEEKLEVGHAVTQTYIVKGDDLHSLVLPEFNIPDFDGVKVYRKTPKKLDEFERLAKIDQASIIQEVTFIFQKDGYYVIPEQKVLWWNTKTKKVEKAVIEEQTFVVGDGVPSLAANDKAMAKQDSVLSSIAVMKWLYGLVVIVFIVAILISIYRHRNALIQSFNRVNNTQRKQISEHYFKNIELKNYQAAIMNLYQLAEIIPSNIKSLYDYLATDSKEQKLLQKLQQLAFSSDSQTDLSISTDEAEQVLTALIKLKSTRNNQKRFVFSMDLNNKDNVIN